MSRRGFVDRKSGTVFFWSQKCACTTLFRTIGRTYGMTNKQVLTRSLPFYQCREIINAEGLRSVILKRDPADRIISCYLNKFVFARKPLREVDDLERIAYKLLVEKAKRFGGDASTNSMTFEDFLRTVQWEMDHRTAPDENSVNGHWDTQIPPSALDFEYDHIIDIREMNEVFGPLCQDLGLDYRRDRANRTPYTEGVDGYLGDRPAGEIAGEPVGRRNFRRPLTERLIRYLYAVDFARFEVSPGKP